ncbi:hypothetical protein C3L33_09079, partial [Rhododendron williamsianum]
IQSVMKLFPNGKAVRLRGNHNKYLSAKEDEISVTQDESGSSENVCWTVKFSPESENKIRLKSCYGKYLTASNKRFILGLTGRKVLQMAGCLDSSEEWEPILEGRNRVKLRTRDGNFLRANGGVSPWLDSVTHDVPWVLQDLVLWDVDVVDIVSEQSPQPKPGVQFESSKSGSRSESNHRHKSPSSVRQEVSMKPIFLIPLNPSLITLLFNSSVLPSISCLCFLQNQTVMERFHNAKAVRLRSNHNKFLSAKEDEISVTQDESGSSENVCWTVEFCSESEDKIRLKSCYGKYLTTSNKRFLLGMTGRKVLQMAGFLDSSVEWQPIWEGDQVKLKTPNGKYLRANDNVWPWRDSVTHDIPYRTAKQDWILWDVEIVSEQSPQPKLGVQESGSSSESESSA